MGIKFESGDIYNIPNDKRVKLKVYNKNNLKEITYVKNPVQILNKYRKTGSNKFWDLKNNELKAYSQPSEFKSLNSLKRTLNGRARDILYQNFSGGNNEKFLTLTFANPDIEFKDLTRIYTNFWNRLKRFYKKQGLELACFYVKEASSNWHIHAILKEINNKKLSIDTETLKKIWGLGNVNIKPVSSNLNAGYRFFNIEEEMDNNNSSQEQSIYHLASYMCKTLTKENVIPFRGRVYGVKGKITYPKTYVGKYSDFLNGELKDSKLIHEQTLLLRDENTDFIINTIHKQTWI